MKLYKLIEQFKKLEEKSENDTFKKSISKVLSLLEQIENKNLTNEEKANIEASISPYLESIHTQTDLKLSLKKLRKSLTTEFGFVPSNYFLTLGIGLGVALGASLGIALGVPFDNGIVFGPMIGSGIGLIGGLIVGMLLDKKKESEDRILRNL